MHTILRIALIVVCVLLVTVILAQANSAGLSATFGGDGTFYRTKRGPEKVLFIATIVLSILFFVIALFLPFTG